MQRLVIFGVFVDSCVGKSMFCIAALSQHKNKNNYGLQEQTSLYKELSFYIYDKKGRYKITKYYYSSYGFENSMHNNCLCYRHECTSDHVEKSCGIVFVND